MVAQHGYVLSCPIYISHELAASTVKNTVICSH